MQLPLTVLHAGAPGAAGVARRALGSGSPLLLRGFLAGWAALRWGDLSYLAARCGGRIVPVESGAHYMAPGHTMERVPLSLLIEYCLARAAGGARELPTLYLAQQPAREMLPEVADDACVPEALAREVIDATWEAAAPPSHPGPRPSETLITSVWLGPAGTLSPLHRDPYHGVLAQVAGTKLVRMYPASTPRGALYPAEGTTQANTSVAVDPRTAPAARFPLLAAQPYLEAVLAPGDALLQPRGTWHMVEAQPPGPSVSVSFWWDEARYGGPAG